MSETGQGQQAPRGTGINRADIALASGAILACLVLVLVVAGKQGIATVKTATPQVDTSAPEAPSPPSQETPALAALPAPVLDADRPGTRRKANLSPDIAQAPKGKAMTGDQVQLALAARWVEYDMLPPSQKTVSAVGKAVGESISTIQRAPEAARPALAFQVQGWARERIAPVLSPSARVGGDTHDILVPASDSGSCRLLGSKWAKGETAESLKTMGFEMIACPDGKTWEL